MRIAIASAVVLALASAAYALSADVEVQPSDFAAGPEIRVPTWKL